MRLLFLVSLLVLSCFAYSQVEQEVIAALKQAQINVAEASKFEKGDGSQIQSQKANGASQAEQVRGAILLEATKLLVNKYGPEIMSQLSELDVDDLLAAASNNNSNGSSY